MTHLAETSVTRRAGPLASSQSAPASGEFLQVASAPSHPARQGWPVAVRVSSRRVLILVGPCHGLTRPCVP